MRFRTVYSLDMDEEPLKPLYDYYNKLSKEEQDRLIAQLEGNTDRIINPEKFKMFSEKLNKVKEFMEKNSVKWYTLDVDIQHGIIKIQFKDIMFDNVEELKGVFDGASFVEFYLNDNDVAEISVQCDIMTEIGEK